MRTMLTAFALVAMLALPAFVLAEDAPAPADALEKPSTAWQTINAEVRKAPRPAQRAKLKELSAAYLERFSAKGGMALGTEPLSLGYIQRAAEDWGAAARSFRSVWANADLADGTRDQAAMHEARLLANKDHRDALGADATTKTIDALTTYTAVIEDEKRLGMRSTIEGSVASALDAMEQKDAALALRTEIIKRDPLQASRMMRPLMSGLLGSTHSMDGYAKIQEASKGLLELLAVQHAKALETLKAKRETAVAALKESNPDAVDENGNLKRTPKMSTLYRVAMNADRQLKSAERYTQRIADGGKPFAMLGKPAQEWTLEHAYSDVKSLADLKGKVVVLDFWATWCPWCIRSFPAIRDLMKDYADMGLVVVGVTASATSVYTQRFDLDDDLRDKATPGQRPRPAARMARGQQRPDGKTLFGPGEYQAKEKEIIKTFIANHQMNWPVVMIDRTEPAPKYALAGWPHAVILDREGRVRYFKSGALLKDRVDAVKKFRAMLEDLLAEKAK